MSKHTKLPWKVSQEKHIYSSGGIFVAQLIRSSLPGVFQVDANAEYIVLACNSHKKLLKACERAHDALLSLHVCNQDNSFADEIRTLLKAAIDKATP